MPEAKVRRGRPKGSGIDDSERLRTIADLMRADPDLKPTTAIKSIGISDPSSIRRLRDKFQECRADLMEEFDGRNRPRMVTNDAPLRSATVSASAAYPETTARNPPSYAPAALSAAADLSRAPTGSSGDPKAWLAVWYGLGLRAMGAAIEAQLSLMQQAMRMPHPAAAVRYQLAMGEMAMTLCLPRAPRRVLH